MRLWISPKRIAQPSCNNTRMTGPWYWKCDLHRTSHGFLDEALPEAARLHQLMEGATLAEGTLLAGRFEIRRMIGVGGMGEVYSSLDRDLGGEVAIKILRPEFQQDVTRLLQEVQTARMVTHPNICRIFDIGRDGDTSFITMELLSGETLATRLEQGPLPAAELATVVGQTAQGLRAAHEAGVLHRDLKPSNVMRLSPSRYIIMDFGLAHRLESGSSAPTGPLVGTIGYLAPEVIAGRPHSVASDIYSLGVLWHEAATGRMPFDEQPAASRGFNGRLQRVVQDCLALDPKRRPASVAEIQQRLAAAHISRRTSIQAAAVAVAATAMSYFARFFRLSSRGAGFGPVDTVLLTPIRNTTGMSRFDGATAMFAGQLTQSPRFNLMDADRQRDLLNRVQRPPDTALTASLAREIALRNGRTAVVYGQVSLLGSDFLVDVKIEQPGSRPDEVKQAATRRFQAAGPDELLEQIRRASLWIRETVGESSVDRDRYNRPPSEVTTPSWDALALREQAIELRAQGRTPEAVALLREAVRVDPGFASAHRDLADILISEDRMNEGYTEWLTAVQASRTRQLNSRERFRLEASYFDDVDDLPAAESINRLWQAAYPNDYLPLFYLGNVCLRLFRLPEGLDLMQQAARRDADVTVLSHLARHLAMQGRFSEADQYIAQVQKLGFNVDAHSLRGIVHMAEGDTNGAIASFQAAVQAGPQPEVRHLLQVSIASVLAELARDEEAERMLLQASAEDERTGSPQRQGDKLGVAAYLAWRRGDLAAARSRAIAASDKAGPLNERASVILARSGALAEAAAVVHQLKTLPDLPRFTRLRDRLRGELLAARGDFNGALVALRRAETLTSAWTLNDSLPRTLALAGQQQEAAKYYRLLLERKGLFWYLLGVTAPGLQADATRGAAAG